MLPYGALWKLDQMLHPAAAPRARTPTLRRRRAAFLFVLAVLLSLLFLVPYHGSHIRRVYTQRTRQSSGVVIPLRNPVDVQERYKNGLKQLREWAAGQAVLLDKSQSWAADRFNEASNEKAKGLENAWASVFYFSAKEELVLNPLSQLPIIVDCAAARQLAGAGAGTVWAEPVKPVL